MGCPLALMAVAPVDNGLRGCGSSGPWGMCCPHVWVALALGSAAFVVVRLGDPRACVACVPSGAGFGGQLAFMVVGLSYPWGMFCPRSFAALASVASGLCGRGSL